MEIGERIRNRRLELSLTQEELAKRVGYSSKTTIAKIETNANQVRQSMITKLAKALDVTPGYLMGWEENMTKENAEFSIDMLEDSRFLEYAKKLFYASESVKEATYLYLDFLLNK